MALPPRETRSESLRMVRGELSWRLASSSVEAFVTETGGHLGPVTFDRKGQKVRPLSVAPWSGELLDRTVPPILRVLRGDFFCLPFGANASRWKGEDHPVHGETANARWRFEFMERHAGRTTLHLSLRTRVRKGRVDKTISLVDGHEAVYSRHMVTEMAGRMALGHHAMVRFPDRPESGVVSTSSFALGQVFPGEFEDPAKGGYSTLRAGAEFASLEKVPNVYGGATDLTRYPARRGFEDLAMLVADDREPFAWAAITFPGERFVWFALKDPRVLRNTVLWFSNGGRHYSPWSGRHTCVLGLEEVTANFHYGLAESVRPNALSRRGHATSVSLDPRAGLDVRTIMAVQAVPAGFDRAVSIHPEPPGRVTLEAASGRRARAAVDLGFLGL